METVPAVNQLDATRTASAASAVIRVEDAHKYYELGETRPGTSPVWSIYPTDSQLSKRPRWKRRETLVHRFPHSAARRSRPPRGAPVESAPGRSYAAWNLPSADPSCTLRKPRNRAGKRA